MHSSEVILKPGTSDAWLKMPDTPTKDERGNVVDIFGPIKVPDGKYWVMGDSRKNSKDSRFFGLLDEDRIYGRASFVVFSVDSLESFWFFEFIKRPISFWTKSIRWDRFFKPLKVDLARPALSVTEITPDVAVLDKNKILK